jgi:hypothetical protein
MTTTDTAYSEARPSTAEEATPQVVAAVVGELLAWAAELRRAGEPWAKAVGTALDGCARRLHKLL